MAIAWTRAACGAPGCNFVTVMEEARTNHLHRHVRNNSHGHNWNHPHGHVQGTQCPETAHRCHEVRTGQWYWPYCRLFLCCTLAAVITIAIVVLVLALVYTEHFAQYSGSSSGTTVPSVTVNISFLFLFHLSLSREYVFQGGSIQCASYRRNSSTYSSAEESAFGYTLNYFNSGISVCTLTILSGGLRIPNWNLISNVHGIIIEGTVWVGVVEAGNFTAVTYNATLGDVLFFPRNRLYWIKNVGSTNSTIVLFFSSQEDPFSLEVNDMFFGTPEDILARALLGLGGIACIRSVTKPIGGDVISLPPNLAQLIHNATYNQSSKELVCKYLYSLNGTRRLIYQGGLSQWARCYRNTNGLSKNATIFSNSLLSHPNTLSIQVLRLNTSSLLTPHSNMNANAMAYVTQGCGKVGIVGPVAESFDIKVGDVFFLPRGMSYYINSTCSGDLIVAIAYTTCSQLETLYLDDYIPAIPQYILAQLFGKNTSCLHSSQENVTVVVLDPDAVAAPTSNRETIDHIDTVLDNSASNAVIVEILE